MISERTSVPTIGVERAENKPSVVLHVICEERLPNVVQSAGAATPNAALRRKPALQAPGPTRMARRHIPQKIPGSAPVLGSVPNSSKRRTEHH